MYIEYSNCIDTIEIQSRIPPERIFIDLNQTLDNSLRVSKNFPRDEFDQCYYYNTEYIDPVFVKINNTDYIEIEWKPEFVTVDILTCDSVWHSCVPSSGVCKFYKTKFSRYNINVISQ